MARSWRGRITVHTTSTPQVTDTHYASTLDFPTRRAALRAAHLYRGYLRRHGDINLLSAPTGLNTPLHFPPQADPRFESGARFTPGGHRNPPKPEYASDVDAWFAEHPDERATWLSHPPKGRL